MTTRYGTGNEQRLPSRAIFKRL